MGLSQSIHLGAYVQCRRPCKTKWEQVFGCTECQTECPDTKDFRFCPACGSRTGLYQKDVDSKYSTYWDVAQKMGDEDMDRLRCEPEVEDDYDIWVSNQDDGTGGGVVDTYESAVVEIPPHQPSEKVNRFLALYARELDVMRKEYGDANVSVKYGIIVSWS